MGNDASKRLSRVSAGLSFGAFFAELDEAGGLLSVHVCDGTDVERARHEALTAARRAGSAVDVRIVTHKLRPLAAPRSIEHWLRRFAAGSVIFDPTLVVRRAQQLLDVARACRRELGKRIAGVYFAPAQRVIYVVMPGVTGAMEHERRLLAAIGEGAAVDDHWPFALRVTATMPRGELTAIDAASAPLHRRLARLIRRGLAPGAFALAVASLSLPAAANNPPRSGSSAMGAASGLSGANARYGMLWGLSVFADGASQPTGGAFAAAGLASFFGEERPGGLDTIRRVAQATTPTTRRTIIRDVTSPGSESGPSGASPGS